jgi:DNA-directed RNA polymerase subunit beta'
MNEVTTPGRLLFKAAVPEQFQKDTEDLNKKKLSDLLRRIAKEDPEAYIDSLQNIGKVSADAVTYYGGVGSISLKDFKTPPALLKLRAKHQQEVDKIINNPKLSDEQKREAVVKYILPEMEKVQKMLVQQDDSDNGLIRQLKVGAKGNPSQIMQLMYGDMLVVDSKGKPIPIAGLRSYGEGAGTKEYWAGSYGSRMGYAAVQFSTGESGYFGKLLTQGAHRVVVTEDDCGANDVGTRQSGDDPHNVGSILIRPVAGFDAGHVIDKKDLNKLKGKDVYIRSAMTCQAEEGICSKCSGHRENGSFPPIGTAVGITAARAVAEPTTQMALSSKHSGGVAGQDEKKVTGFKEVAQFVNVPKHFVGGATLAEVPGIVSRIDKAPQGGQYVTIAKEQHYVPQNVKLTVKRGDKVEAGDMLSEGIPNPAEIVRHKGIGEGRRYFAEKYTEILKNNGAGNHRRNVEAIARGLINRVKITDPKGFNGYYMDDVVPYDMLVRDYKPRKGFTVKTPVASKGLYLEKPVLHYTVGTKITGSVAKNLSNAGIKSIVVHKEKVPFDSVMPRVMDIPGTDPDWQVRLGGFNLKRTFLDAATKGATSKTGDTSYIPSIVKGEEIYSDYTEDKK